MHFNFGDVNYLGTFVSQLKIKHQHATRGVAQSG